MRAIRDLTYKDAITILTGADTRVASILDTVLGAGILASIPFAGGLAVDLLEPKNEIRKLISEPLGRAAANLRGLRIADRTARIYAANCVLIVSSIFDATKNIIGAEWTNLEITDREAANLFGRPLRESVPNEINTLVEFLAVTPIPLPDPATSFTETLASVETFFAEYSTRLLHFLSGLALWEDFSARRQVEAHQILSHDLPRLARSLYEEKYQRLAGDVPEFSEWANLREHQATHTLLSAVQADVHEIGRGLTTSGGELASELSYVRESLARIVESIQGERSQSVDNLARLYAAGLERPLLDATDDELSELSPTIRTSFVEPSCKVSEYTESSRPTDEDWWAEGRQHSSTQEFVAAYLTTPKALRSPLIVFGHPGAGKSVLTKVLAAQLDPATFLPIRVPLREVSANASISEQIDQALHGSLQANKNWTEICESASHLLPVIFLDGLDELIQASGTSRSNYLEQVVEFQWTAESQDRPAAVIVTSRTTMADVTRIPRNATMIKIDTFDSGRIVKWINQWNAANSVQFEHLKVAPLRSEIVLRNKDLASHPILLLMLALYDADGNSLAVEDSHLAGATLYGKLIEKFVRREVLKDQDSGRLSTELLAGRIQGEIYSLCLIALSMFNRGEQVARRSEIDSDFDSLTGGRPEGSLENFDRPLSRSGQMIGKFFFLSHSTAREIPAACDGRLSIASQGSEKQSFEFAHSTFGEYLVARLFVHLIKGARRIVPASLPWECDQEIIDDAMLRTLFSSQPLTKRRQVVRFVAEISSAPEFADISAIIVRLLARSQWPSPSDLKHPSYLPRLIDEPAKYANYSVNLAITYGAARGIIDVEKLLPGHRPSSRIAWREYVLLWESRLDSDAWRELTSILHCSTRSKDELIYNFVLNDSSSSLDLGRIEKFLELFQARSEDAHLRDTDGGAAEESEPKDGEKEIGFTISTSIQSYGGNSFIHAQRRNELVADFYNTRAAAGVFYLGRVIGDIVYTIPLPREGWFNTDPFDSNGVIVAELLTMIAYPPKRLNLVCYELVLDVLRSLRRREDGVRITRQLLRQLNAELEMIPNPIVEQVLELAMSLGPSDADLPYYKAVTILACRAASSSPLPEDKARYTEIAARAFGRFDALHLSSTRSSEYVQLIMDVENTGVEISAVSPELGSFDEHIERVYISEISENLSCAMKLISFIRRRCLVDCAARGGVSLILALPTVAVMEIIPEEDLSFIYSSHKLRPNHVAAETAEALHELFTNFRNEVTTNSDAGIQTCWSKTLGDPKTSGEE